MKWLKRSAIGLCVLVASRARGPCGRVLGARHRERRDLARAAPRRRRTDDLDRARPRLVARRLASRRRAPAHGARRARHRRRSTLEWNGPALLTGRARVHARRCGAGDVPPRARRHGRRRRSARAAVAAAHRGRKRHDAVDHGRWTARCSSRRRPSQAPTAAAGSSSPTSRRTFGDAALAANATFELTDGIELDVAGEWSGPLAGVAASGSVELTGTWPNLDDSPRACRSVRGDRRRARSRRAVPLRRRQRVAKPRVAGRRPASRARAAGSRSRARWPTIATTAPARSMSWAAPRASPSEARASDSCSTLAPLELAPAAPGGGTLRGVGSLDLESRETSARRSRQAASIPTWIVAAWPGRLDGTARLRAGLAPEPNVALDAIALAGELRGYPVTIGGAAALTGRDRVRLDALRLDSGSNRVVLTGALDRETARPHRRREARRARPARPRRRRRADGGR